MNLRKPLRFHWSLSQAGDQHRRTRSTKAMGGLPSLEAQKNLCRRAEEAGIESMLMAIGFTRPEPTLLSTVLGLETERVKFMIACRAGLLSPTMFAQQINTLSQLIGDRIMLNMVVGHTPKELGYYGDFLGHDARFDRTAEFLAVCRAFWKGNGKVDFKGDYYEVTDGQLGTPYHSDERPGPEIYVGGNSAKASELAVAHADCLWRFPDDPEKLRKPVANVVSRGTEAGLLVGLIVRPTREEALEAARNLISGFGSDSRIANREFAKNSDSKAFTSTYGLTERSEWLTPCLWTGAIPFLGPPAIALVGSADDVADEIMRYKAIGISQYLFTGWPDDVEVGYFAKYLLPAVRKRERGGFNAPDPRKNSTVTAAQ